MVVLKTFSQSFLTVQEEKFQAYSEYCNNHPDAVAKLAELQSIQNYKFFFEVHCCFLSYLSVPRHLFFLGV